MPLNPSDPQAIVNVHNAYRSDPSVNAQNLVWDASLATGAQSWADSLATTYHQSQPSPDVQNPVNSLGENIAVTPTGSKTAAQMADLWGTQEKPNFKPGIYPNVKVDSTKDVSHYTQVIWATTTKVGCGLASDSTTGNDYLVCRYFPWGNRGGTGMPSPQPVTLAQVSVADAMNAFGVDAANNVYWYLNYNTAAGWTWTPQMLIAGQQLKQVSLASDQTVYGLDTSGAVWRYNFNASTWITVAAPVAFISISCAASNNICAVGTDTLCYQNTGSGWAKIPNSSGGTQISVALDGTIWALRSNGAIWQYTGNGNWDGSCSYNTGWALKQMSGGTATNLCAIDMSNGFYKYTGPPGTPGATATWTQVAPGTGKQISVAYDGTIWSIGTDNLVYRLVNNAWTKLLV